MFNSNEIARLALLRAKEIKSRKIHKEEWQKAIAMVFGLSVTIAILMAVSNIGLYGFSMLY